MLTFGQALPKALSFEEALSKGYPEFRRDQERDPKTGQWSGGSGTPLRPGHEARDLLQRNLNARRTPTRSEFEASLTKEQQDFLRQRRDQLAKETPTDRLYRHSGKWDDTRAALHEKLIQQRLDDAMVRAKPAPGEAPKLVVMGGRPGSGKTTLLMESGFVPDMNKYLYVNADDLRGDNKRFKAGDDRYGLPGYEGWNSSLYHTEASEMMDELEKRGRELGLNIIHDATMRSASAAEKLVHDFEDAGYDISGLFVHASPENAALRAISRGMKPGGRFVPTYILGTHVNEAAFDAVKYRMSNWKLYDANGRQAHMVASGNKDRVTYVKAKAMTFREVLKAGPPDEPRDPHTGRWVGGSTPPEVGQPFHVFRLGSGVDLSNRNAADAKGVAEHLARQDDFTAPGQSRLGDQITMYEVTVHKPFGRYQGYTRGKPDYTATPNTDSVGFGRGAFSFPQGGPWSAHVVKTVSLSQVRSILSQWGYSSFDDSGSIEGAKAISQAFGKAADEFDKYREDQARAPKGQPGGGRWISEGFGDRSFAGSIRIEGSRNSPRVARAVRNVVKRLPKTHLAEVARKGLIFRVVKDMKVAVEGKRINYGELSDEHVIRGFFASRERAITVGEVYGKWDLAGGIEGTVTHEFAHALVDSMVPPPYHELVGPMFREYVQLSDSQKYNIEHYDPIWRNEELFVELYRYTYGPRRNENLYFDTMTGAQVKRAFPNTLQRLKALLG
jgi:predicted ABC-type ATPase